MIFVCQPDFVSGLLLLAGILGGAYILQMFLQAITEVPALRPARKRLPTSLRFFRNLLCATAICVVTTLVLAPIFHGTF
jgi:hypothetical protein